MWNSFSHLLFLYTVKSCLVWGRNPAVMMPLLLGQWKCWISHCSEQRSHGNIPRATKTREVGEGYKWHGSCHSKKCVFVLSGHFRLDPESGELRTAVNLDYEEVSQYVILIQATEKVSSAAEVQRSGNFLPWRTFQGSNGHMFCICNPYRSCGSLTCEVWCERWKAGGQGGSLVFFPGLFAENVAMLTISVQDVNEEPVFSSSSYSARIPNSVPYKYPIITVQVEYFLCSSQGQKSCDRAGFLPLY